MIFHVRICSVPRERLWACWNIDKMECNKLVVIKTVLFINLYNDDKVINLKSGKLNARTRLDSDLYRVVNKPPHTISQKW